MKLHLPELMHELRSRPLAVVDSHGMPETQEPHHRGRAALLGRLLPLMHQAQKFIFDSGSDQDPDTITAVRETSVAMLEAGLFHLPHPVCWIEEPYSDDQDELRRNYYLAEEGVEGITLHFFQRANPADLAIMPGGRLLPTFLLHRHAMFIDLKTASDRAILLGAQQSNELYAAIIGEALYGLKKFVVCLNTEQLVIDQVPAGRGRGVGTRQREYAHTIVRIPLEPTLPASEGGGAKEEGKRRRRTLVRGFVWGKHTRPPEEQRWIRPHWRGDASLGTVERSHHVVR